MLIKSHIKTSTFDLFDVWQAIKYAITNQLKELKHLRASQQMRIPLDVSGALLAVRGWVSRQALRKVQDQQQLLQKPHKATCSQTFTASHGLPCSHTLRQLEDQRQSLLLKHFHPHWHLKRDVAQPPPILEPQRATNQAKQKLTQPTTSTRREPCGFEKVEGVRKAPSICSKCHTLGHIMTSKTCPLRFKELPPQTAQAPEPKPTASTAMTPTLVPIAVLAELTTCDSMAGHAASSTAAGKSPSEGAQRPLSVIQTNLMKVSAISNRPSSVLLVCF